MVDHFISETTHTWVCVCVLRRFSCVYLQLWTIFHQGPLPTGILQARILEWFAMPSCGDFSRLRDQTCVSYVPFIGRWVLYHQCHLGSPHTWAARCCPWRSGISRAGLGPGRLCRKAVPPQTVEMSRQSSQVPVLYRQALNMSLCLRTWTCYPVLMTFPLPQRSFLLPLLKIFLIGG